MLTAKRLYSGICAFNNIRSEVRRIPAKVKLVTVSYIVQSIGAKISSQPENGTCLLCEESEETICYFLL